MKWEELLTIIIAKIVTDKDSFKNTLIFIAACILMVVFIVFLVKALDRDTTPPSSILDHSARLEVLCEQIEL